MQIKIYIQLFKYNVTCKTQQHIEQMNDNGNNNPSS